MRRQLTVLAAALVAACTRAPKPDAYGTFETTEVVVSTSAGGQLLSFTPAEGAHLDALAIVAAFDTAQLVLEREQAKAQRSAGSSRGNEVSQQLGVLEAQRDIAKRAYERTQRLFSQQAATAQQLDQAERDYRVLEQQIEGVRAQHQTVSFDASAIDAHIAQIADRLKKSRITNPISGTVLTTYAKAGEFLQPGQPLYKIANLDSMVLRAYITETQLAQVRIGQPVDVSIDVGPDARQVLRGTVTWVASQAEFTPTPIQTREERADLVYAVKISVPNPQGQVKIGMPADVRFVAPATP